MHYDKKYLTVTVFSLPALLIYFYIENEGCDMCVSKTVRTLSLSNIIFRVGIMDLGSLLVLTHFMLGGMHAVMKGM